MELGKKYDQKDILESLQNAEFLDTVQIMPEKYNTHIGESGIKISGGQKQRLILTRNMITNPKILIIDNGLTGLDMETRQKVIDRITNKDKNMTLIIITNMIEEIKDADKIYKLEDKTLKELSAMEV